MPENRPLPARLVIIDDNLPFRDLLTEAVRRDGGFQLVGTAVRASDGLELCGREQPDVAILDVELPDASGLDQVRAIRRLSPHTRILVFSGHAQPALVRRALEVGVHGYIEKPADLGTLLKALRQVAGGSLSFSRQVLPGRRANPPGDITAFPSSAWLGGPVDERHDAILKLGFGLLFLAFVLAWACFINLP